MNRADSYLKDIKTVVDAYQAVCYKIFPEEFEVQQSNVRQTVYKQKTYNTTGVDVQLR